MITKRTKMFSDKLFFKLLMNERAMITGYKMKAIVRLLFFIVTLLMFFSVSNVAFGDPLLVLERQFQGIYDTGWFPPDTQGAAGPSSVVVAVNGQVAIHNNSSWQYLNSLSEGNFWSSLLKTVNDPKPTDPGEPAEYPFDPKVIYDEHIGRFIIIELGSNSQIRSNDQPLSSWLLVAVSKNSNPKTMTNADWNGWAINAMSDWGESDAWADYPKIGVDKDNLYVTANMADYPTLEAFWNGIVWVIPKDDVFLGNQPGDINNTKSVIKKADNGDDVPIRLQPTQVFDNSPEYLLDSTDNYYYKITFQDNKPKLSKVGSINYNSCSDPDSAPQKGNDNDIDSGECDDIQNAVCRNGYIWATRTTGVTVNGDDKDAIAWYQIDPNKPNQKPVQEGLIEDQDLSYYYPSIAVNKYNDVVIGFSGSSSNTYVGAYFTGRQASDPPGHMGPVRLLKAGVASYYKPDSGWHGIGKRNRWGDYSATIADPLNLSFWTGQEYAGGVYNKLSNTWLENNTWGTWWGNIFVSPPTNPTNVWANHYSSHVIPWGETIEIHMSGAVDNSGSGLKGYYYKWDHNKDTDVDENNNDGFVADNGPNDTILNWSPDPGTWWLHIRTVDNDHHLAIETKHVGPFIIDKGPRLVFDSDRNHNSDIYLADWYGDQNEPAQLTQGPAANSNPVFYPADSRWVAFQANHSGNKFNIYITDSRNPNPANAYANPLTTDTADDMYPAFSPDGTKMAFSSKRRSVDDSTTGGIENIYVVDINYDPANPEVAPAPIPGTLKKLTSEEQPGPNDKRKGAGHPTFSPDGTRIIFDSDRNTADNDKGARELYCIMDNAEETEDSPAHQLTHVDVENNQPIYANNQEATFKDNNTLFWSRNNGPNTKYEIYSGHLKLVITVGKPDENGMRPIERTIQLDGQPQKLPDLNDTWDYKHPKYTPWGNRIGFTGQTVFPMGQIAITRSDLQIMSAFNGLISDYGFGGGIAWNNLGLFEKGDENLDWDPNYYNGILPETKTKFPPIPDSGNHCPNCHTTASSAILTPSKPGYINTQLDKLISGIWSTYDETMTLNEGEHTLFYYSADYLDNREDIQSTQYINDTTPPVNPEVTSTSHIIGKSSNNKKVDVGISGAWDGVSGVAGYSVEWSQDATTSPDEVINIFENQASENPHTNPSWKLGSSISTTSPELTDGSWYFHLRTVDNFGNWSQPVHLGPFIIDTVAPTTTLATSPTTEDGLNGWFKSVPSITLSSDEPGITYYQFDSTSTAGWDIYAGSIGAPVGEHTLYYYTTDIAGNTEEIRSNQIKLDPIAPSGFNLLGPANGEETTSATPLTPTFSWDKSADTVSGISKYQLFIDGTLAMDNIDPSTQSVTPSTPLGFGKRTWLVKAFDMAGNEKRSNTANILTVNQSASAHVGVGTQVAITLNLDTTVTVTFAEVKSGGTLTVTEVSNEAPQGFELVGSNGRSKSYDIQTTAVYTSPVSISFSYNNSDIIGTKSSLRVLHYENGVPVDCTTSSDGNNNIVTCTVNSLSPFGLVEPDNTPPATILSTLPLEPDGESGWFVSTPSISLSSNESGITYYQLDSAGTVGWTPYSGNLTAPEGDHTLYYYSVDKSGNSETIKSQEIKVDTKAPGSPTLTSPSNPVGVPSRNNTVSIYIQGATDTASGVDGYSSLWSTLATKAAGTIKTCEASQSLITSPPLSDGSWYVHVRAKDLAGNWSSSVNLGPFVIDRQAPITTITSYPASPDGLNGWYKSTLLITLSNNKSGDTYYSWNSSNGPWTQYTSTFEALGGQNTLYYYSADLAGNTETVKSASFKVDTDIPGAPTLSGTVIGPDRISLSWDTPMDSSSWVAGYDIYNADNDTTLTTTLGTSHVFSGLNSSTTYRYYVRAFDVAGNPSNKSNTLELTTLTKYTGSVQNGSSMRADLIPNMSLTFDRVATPGGVQVVKKSPDRDAPSGYQFVPGAYYELSTSANYSGSITVALPYDKGSVSGDQSNLRLFHWENGYWHDVTVNVDTDNGVVYGEVPSLSPFAIAVPASSTSSVPASSSWSLGLIVLFGIVLLAKRASTARKI